MIERGRTQLRRNPLDHRDADVDQPDQRLQAIHHRQGEVLALECVGGASEFELERRQRLAQLVVQFARHRRAFFFTCRLKAHRETPHLFLRRAELTLCFDARRDVSGNALHGDQFAGRIADRHDAVLGEDDSPIGVDPADRHRGHGVWRRLRDSEQRGVVGWSARMTRSGSA